MDDDVDAAEAMKDRLGHDGAAFGSGDIRRNEQIGVGESGGRRTSGGEDLRTDLAQSRDRRCADPLGAARNERPAAIQLETVAHGRISSEALFSPPSTKVNRQSAGPPRKLPARRSRPMIIA